MLPPFRKQWRNMRNSGHDTWSIMKIEAFGTFRLVEIGGWRGFHMIHKTCYLHLFVDMYIIYMCIYLYVYVFIYTFVVRTFFKYIWFIYDYHQTYAKGLHFLDAFRVYAWDSISMGFDGGVGIKLMKSGEPNIRPTTFTISHYFYYSIRFSSTSKVGEPTKKRGFSEAYFLGSVYDIPFNGCTFSVRKNHDAFWCAWLREGHSRP